MGLAALSGGRRRKSVMTVFGFSGILYLSLCFVMNPNSENTCSFVSDSLPLLGFVDSDDDEL